MKKLILFASLLFIMGCGATKSKEIKQSIGYDNISSMYSITTTFEIPKGYNNVVFCEGPKIDSLRKVEYNKAVYIQEEMNKNNY